MIKKIKKTSIKDGNSCFEYELSNAFIKLRVIEYGASITSWKVALDTGWREIALGYDTLDEYQKHDGCFGATIGRYANRIKNAEFEWNKKRYQLYANNFNNTLHGGKEGFHMKYFHLKQMSDDAITLRYESVDGEEGFPGHLILDVTYRLCEQGVDIIYDADCDQDTLCNITNHTYFNLNKDSTSEILNHTLTLNGTSYMHIDEQGLANGIVENCKHTPFDFSSMKQIGKDLHMNHVQLINGHGYDHYFLSNEAVLQSDSGDLKMKLVTTLPGMQIYTPNFQEPRIGHDNMIYKGYAAICLEPGFAPDDIHREALPGSLLHCGEHYHQELHYTFENNLHK